MVIKKNVIIYANHMREPKELEKMSFWYIFHYHRDVWCTLAANKLCRHLHFQFI
ncbi:uncharacterized protein DS421_13g427920 [Arachis hypogaea]|nr:uncharacterized protein DS421_13g427920 [Arachis hypogaea]